ncbi:hypothetical protein AB0I85_27265 [Micromonospora echinofusca]|uniref:hypothetical protein n=1 Tax=Micromonospora echinofusca TaxID=47858 RepID=UPI000EAE35B9
MRLQFVLLLLVVAVGQRWAIMVTVTPVVGSAACRSRCARSRRTWRTYRIGGGAVVAAERQLQRARAHTGRSGDLLDRDRLLGVVVDVGHGPA